MAKKKIENLTEKTSPSVDDLLLLADTEDSNKWKNVTIENLMIQAKGYKEYTFAIRQSGTDAPTIYVIKDDFGLETPLTFYRTGRGIYYSSIISEMETLDTAWTLNVSNSNGRTNIEGVNGIGIISGYLGVVGSGNGILIRTYNQVVATGVSELDDGIMTDANSVTISIRETLEDT